MREGLSKIYVSQLTERKYRALLNVVKRTLLPGDRRDIRKAFHVILRTCDHDATLYGQPALDFGLDLKSWGFANLLCCLRCFITL